MRPRRLRTRGASCLLGGDRMEERKDPMGLWVGSWTPEAPEALLKREGPRREQEDQAPRDEDPRPEG